MTTAMTTATPTPDAVLAALQKARAARKDEGDLPMSMTRRQVEEYATHTRQLDGHIMGITFAQEMIATFTTRRAPKQAALAKLRQAERALDAMRANAPDWRTMTDARERDKEWGRQEMLYAAKTALARGVEYFGGEPALPHVLRELLTETCPTCGHSELLWSAPISTLEADVAELDASISEYQGKLAAHLDGATALLNG